jgi:hypothetical protein
MAEHTPGPWEVGGVGNTCVTPSTDKQERICVCWDTFPKQLDDGSWEDHTQEIQANARLIAAAPELLAALKECRDRLSDWVECSDRNEDVADDNAALEMAIAAIAKAEGRSE